MTPDKLRFARLILAAALLGAPLSAMAQTTDADPAGADAPAAAAAVPTMAEIEQAWAANDFVTVREGLKILAETEGSALAQYRYGRVLAEGRGGPRDIEGAAQWLQQAVQQGNNDAAVLLARIYLSSQSDDAAKAAGELLSLAAARGQAEGQYYLGLLYRSGRGVEQDMKQAYNWFLASAEQGFVESQYELARAYSRGEGTIQDNEEAVKWLSEAASNGHVNSQMLMANALAKGQGVAQDEKAAVNWYRRAAEAGNLVAQRELGMHYLRGVGADPNPEEALRWLSAAAQAGEPGAQVNLGLAFAEGEEFGIKRNDEIAVQWYAKAAAQSSPQGMTALARMQETGRGMPQDLPAAVDLLRRAVREMGFAPAALRLGELAGEGKLDGLVAPQTAVPWVVLAAETGNEAARAWLDEQAAGENRPARTGLALLLLKEEGQEPRAAALFAAAAEEGDVLAQFKLGELYATGAGVDLDYVQAHKWFNIAAAQGNAAAAEQRANVGKLMTPEQIAEAQALARTWFDQESARIPQTDQKQTQANPAAPRTND